MMDTEYKRIKDLRGQSWFSFDIKSVRASEDTGNKNAVEGKTRNESTCMKLPREDMFLFGICPKTETFELVVCNICGQKYKLPAFGEHIKRSHSNGDKSPASVKLDKTEKHVQKKGKLKRTKEKPKAKEKIEALGKTVNIDMKVDFMEIVSDRQSLPLESETVPKFKQINVKTNKKNQKNLENDSIKEDSNLSDKGNTCISKNECVSDISCKISTDPVWPKAHVQLGNSSIVQDGEIVNMQPRVQLSPLSNTSTITSNLSKSVVKNSNKILEHQPVSVSERPYHPDIHCGVLDKENKKPCIQPLNCAYHSLALKKAVQGRSKAFESLLKEKRYDEPIKISEASCSVNLGKVNNSSPATSKHPSKSQPSTTSRTEKTESFDESESKNKTSKRVTSDRPRLSLPVSIKNPTILCQLQNKVLKSTKFSLPAESTRNENIQEVIKENFVQKQIRNPRACRGFKENSRLKNQKKESTGDSETAESLKACDEQKLETFEQWHPGFRRVGGLLYASHSSIPQVNRTSVIPTASSSTAEENCSSIIEPTFYIIDEKSEVIDLCGPSVNKIDFKKNQFEIDCGTKKSVSSLSSKQKGHVLVSANSSKSQPQKQKLTVNQPVTSSNKTVICKRPNSSINGAVPAKKKKQEGLMNIVGNVFGKNDHTLPVMHLEVANNVFEKQILTPSHIPSANSLGATVQTGLNVNRGSPIRLGPPRFHYITASGPLPVSIQQVASVQQLQLKPMRVQQHKYQLLSPPVNISPTSGVFYIPKTSTNSSNINGMEER